MTAASPLAYQGPVEPPTDPSGVTGRLVTWLHGFDLSQAPEDVVTRAKALILDGLGCALVGAQLPWSRTAVEAVLRLEGQGEHQIVGWGRATSAPAAALLNGTFVQGFELDDFHPLGPLHSASVVLPALIATSEALGRTSGGEVSGEAFLCAALAGFEVGPRVGMALHGAQMLSRGWHSGSVFGTHAAAASAGLLLQLDPARLEDAVGLAGTQSAGLMAAQYEAMSKRMHHGFAARNGLYAAFLAAGGYTGIKRVFEREYGGFLSVFGEGHDPDASQVVDGFGERWETLRIAIKPYAAMGALHAPLDALFDIAARRTLRPEDIESIRVDMGHAAYHHGWWEVERPLTPIGAQMNVAYALAAAILDGAAMLDQFTPERIDRDDVWALIPKIRAVHDESFDKLPTGRGASRVTIVFTDGSTETAHLPMTRTIAAPLDTDGVVAKFRVLTQRIMTAERQDALIQTVFSLERQPSVGPLLDLLAPPVGAAFT